MSDIYAATAKAGHGHGTSSDPSDFTYTCQSESVYD